MTWALSLLAQRRALALGETKEGLTALRRVGGLVLLRHACLGLALLAGLGLLLPLAPATAHAAWLQLKIGLVVFLVVPLEGMHAYVCQAWIARGLRATGSPPFSKDLARGLGMEEMIRALELPLLGMAVPLLAWLSLAKPF